MEGDIFIPIDKDTPIEEVFRMHQIIWDEVIKTFESDLVIIKPVTPYRNDCALCAYGAAKAMTDHIEAMCAHCPAKWPGDCKCFDVNGLYAPIRLEIEYINRRDGREYATSHYKEILDRLYKVRNLSPKEVSSNGECQHPEDI